MALIPGVRRHTSKARLRLTGVPECPLDVPEYSSDGPSYNPSDNGTPERGGLGASVDDTYEIGNLPFFYH